MGLTSGKVVGVVRDEKVVVRLAPQIKNKVQVVADEMGVTMSAYIAHVVGQHVITQENLTKTMPEQLKGIFVGMIEKGMLGMPEGDK